MSAAVFVTAGVTKFTSGAWVAVAAVGLFVLVATRIRHFYEIVAEATALHPHATEVPRHRVAPSVSRPPALPGVPEGPGQTDRSSSAEREFEDNPEEIRNLTIAPVVALDLPGMRALAYAASLEQPVLALHVSPTEGEANRFREYWLEWGDHLPLEVIISPHRALVAPLVNYISTLHRQRPDLTMTVVLPDIIVHHWWHRTLETGIGPRLRRSLRPLPKIVVTTVPFHLRD